jgi:hypothetical protein
MWGKRKIGDWHTFMTPQEIGDSPLILIGMRVEEGVEQEFVRAVRLGTVLAPESDQDDMPFFVFHINDSCFSCDLVFSEEPSAQ